MIICKRVELSQPTASLESRRQTSVLPGKAHEVLH